eukprot:12360187-Karenia_brevis.AAC.1
MAAKPSTEQTLAPPRFPSTVHTTYNMSITDMLHAAGLEDVHTPAETAQYGLWRPLPEDPGVSG